MKKLILLLLSAVVMCSLLGFSSSAESVATPYYNNVARTATGFIIEDDIAEISLDYRGYRGVTQLVEISTVLSKLSASEWIEISSWLDRSTEYRNNILHTANVDSGTYRVVVEYKFYGSGGETDVINYEEQIIN